MRTQVASFALALALFGAAASAQSVAVGDAAPDFTLPSLEGTEHMLSERTGEGPVVLIFFRGAW